MSFAWLTDLIIKYPMQAYIGFHVLLILVVIELRRFIIFLFKSAFKRESFFSLNRQSAFKRKSKTNSQGEQPLLHPKVTNTQAFSSPPGKIIHDTSDPLFFINRKVKGQDYVEIKQKGG